jgi:hypothetical protein
VADDGFRALEQELRAPPPEGLKRLSDGELLDLAGAVKDARLLQAAAMQRAGEQALGNIPRLLRGPIRKLLGAR